MIRRKKEALSASEAELRQATAELKDVHNDASLPAMLAAVGNWIDVNEDGIHERTQAGAFSRRGLLIGGGAAAIGGALLAACGSSPSTAPKATSTTTAPKSGVASLTGDLKVAALAASLENLAVFAYRSGLSAAQAGKLGAVPPAVGTFASTAMNQHEQHAAAWNAALTGAGKQKVTETDPALTPTVKNMFASVTDVAGLAKLALDLETIAAQTYQAAVDALSSHSAVQIAATIQPVEMQHIAILNLVLGQYPIPNAFNPTSMARTTTDLGN